jgi:transposase
MRYEFTDNEWAAIGPMLPNKPRGVTRADNRLGLALPSG